jgi:hypothetical protein
MRVYIGHIWGQQWGMRAYMGHMGAAMGHACAHAWAIYGGIHGPHGSSNGACMGAYMGHMGVAMGHVRAYMAIYGSSPIGRVGRKGIVGNPFPSLVIPAPSLPLLSLLEGKGAGVILFPSLPYSVA